MVFCSPGNDVLTSKRRNKEFKKNVSDPSAMLSYPSLHMRISNYGVQSTYCDSVHRLPPLMSSLNNKNYLKLHH